MVLRWTSLERLMLRNPSTASLACLEVAVIHRVVFDDDALVQRAAAPRHSSSITASIQL